METKQTLLASPAISRRVETDDEFDLDIKFVILADRLRDVNVLHNDSIRNDTGSTCTHTCRKSSC